MNPIKRLRARLGQRVVHAWEGLSEGWRELLSRSSGALTHFDAPTQASKNEESLRENEKSRRDLPEWSLLASEVWETALSVIIRVEIPGMKREDLDISVEENVLRIRGEKRSLGDHQGRLYHLLERAFGHFERTIPLPRNIDVELAEVNYQDGVITVILPRTEPIPPINAHKT